MGQAVLPASELSHRNGGGERWVTHGLSGRLLLNCPRSIGVEGVMEAEMIILFIVSSSKKDECLRH